MSYVALLGASGTIGTCLARRLTARGTPLILLGRQADRLQTLGAELSQPWAVFDAGSSASLDAILREQLAVHGPLAGIVNCIGSLLLKPAHGTSDDEFRSMVETNLFTAFAAVKVAGKLLRETGGSIVLLASAAAEIGIQNHEAIAAAKAGVVGLARAAAATYAPQNIRVNVVSPGLIKTELSRRIWSNPNAAEASEALHPLGRLGEPEHVASLVEWLLRPENDWITGQVLGVDGGLAHVLPRR